MIGVGGVGFDFIRKTIATTIRKNAPTWRNTHRKKRLQNKSINFIETDILNFNSHDKYDIWHDRAVFHFITDHEGIKKYISLCNEYIKKEGILIIGTFAEDGPLKCSGLEIKRYSVDQISTLFKETFRLVESFKMLHKTPFHTEQSFSFCVLRKSTDH